MVVGHQHGHAEPARGGDALKAGNAVVNRDQHVGAACLDTFGDGRRQAITINHAVGHDVTDVLGAQEPQAANADGTGGGAVAVVISDDAQLLLPGDGVGQQHGGVLRAFH